MGQAPVPESAASHHISELISEMASLFDAPVSTAALPGLTYVSDAVSADDERELGLFIKRLDLTPFAFRGFTGNRRTVSFGWRYDFNGGGFQRAKPLPDILQSARANVAEQVGEPGAAFEQCSVIEYAPGAGIGWHKDRPQFGKVAGLSLLAPCRFRFRREREGGGWAREALLLQPRSAYLIDGEARLGWQHSIPPLDRLRYSITFRTLAA
jgi:alkylated DNA repair dioxygenase AlkB